MPRRALDGDLRHCLAPVVVSVRDDVLDGDTVEGRALSRNADVACRLRIGQHINDHEVLGLAEQIRECARSNSGNRHRLMADIAPDRSRMSS